MLYRCLHVFGDILAFYAFPLGPAVRISQKYSPVRRDVCDTCHSGAGELSAATRDKPQGRYYREKAKGSMIQIRPSAWENTFLYHAEPRKVNVIADEMESV
jgi:hypothetical protein